MQFKKILCYNQVAERKKRTPMEVTDVKIKLLDGETRVVAVAAVTFDDCFVVHGINVINGQNGRFIAMPSRKISDSVFLDIVHPTNSETRKMIEEAIFAAIDKLSKPQ